MKDSRVRAVALFVCLCAVAQVLRADLRTGLGTGPEEKDTDAVVGLANYKLDLGPKEIKGVSRNASGLAYNAKTDTIFLVLNKPTVVLELDLKGNTKRKIGLKFFNDTEGITWIKGHSFAVLEERRRKLIMVEIGADTKSVDYLTRQGFVVEPKAAGNAGLEGVTYDAAGGRFFVVKEKSPRRIYEVRLPTKGAEEKAVITTPWDIDKTALGMTDLAGVCYDPGTGHLLILSDESKCVVECTTDGQLISRLSLKAGNSGLKATLRQPEGITVDNKGNLYICSEPNLFYVFRKKN